MAVFLNHLRWKFHDLRPSVHLTAMASENITRFYVADEQANILENLQGRSMSTLDLFLGEKGSVAH